MYMLKNDFQPMFVGIWCENLGGGGESINFQIWGGGRKHKFSNLGGGESINFQIWGGGAWPPRPPWFLRL